MKFRVLGPLSVEGASGPLDLGGPRQRSVLARLLVAGGDVVSVDRLLEDLWSGESPPRAMGSLQAFISHLRRTLEPERPPRSPARLLVSSAPGYALRVDAESEVDAVVFERLVRDGSRLLAQGRPEQAGAAFDAALGLFRGDAYTAYADFADQAWAAPEIARLEHLRLVARERRMLTHATERNSTVAAQRTPLGRAAPLQALMTVAGEALAGGVRVAVVSGEPGLGKTFLAEAVSERLRTGGWRIAWGRCPEGEGVPALWPWQQVLGPLVSAIPPPAELAGRLANLLGTERWPLTSDAAEARFRQHDAVARHLALATAKEPLLVVLDDLQWADAGSLRLLLDLITLRRGGRILVIATVRSGEGRRALDDALGRLGREGALRLSLHGLENEAVAELSGSLGLQLDGVQAAELAARTAGNPFLLQETVRLAATEGTGSLLAGTPPTLGDLLRQRLRRLPDDVHELLTTAAVLGREVEPELLAAVAFIPEEQVLDGLDLATVNGVLVEGSPRRRRFAHDLIRETLESELPPMRRTTVHARTADALESADGDPAAIAYHALAAGPAQSQRAAHFAYAAGVSARQRLAFDEAADWFAKTADAAQSEPEPDWAAIVGVQLELVRVQIDAGEWGAASETRAAAIRAADLTDDPELALGALVALDAPAVWPLHRDAEVALDIAQRIERALAGLAIQDSELRCRLVGALAAELSDGSDDPRCDELSREAVEMARRLGDPRLLVAALTDRCHAVNQPRFAAELVSVGQELVELGVQEGMPAYELLGHEVVAMYRLQLFDIRGAEAAAAASEPLLRRLSRAPAFHRGWQAMRLLADGQLEEDALDSLPFASPMLAHSLKVWSLAERGLASEARELLDAENPPVPHDWSQLALLAVAAQAAVAAGHPARMHWCYEQLLPYSGWFAVGGNSLVLGPVDYHLALLAGGLGDPEASEQHRARAESDCRAAELLWWADRSAALAKRQPTSVRSHRPLVR